MLFIIFIEIYLIKLFYFKDDDHLKEYIDIVYNGIQYINEKYLCGIYEKNKYMKRMIIYNYLI